MTLGYSMSLARYPLARIFLVRQMHEGPFPGGADHADLLAVGRVVVVDIPRRRASSRHDRIGADLSGIGQPNVVLEDFSQLPRPAPSYCGGVAVAGSKR